jgi:hypothetical protein
MRALSVKQPWCELIADGRKHFEVRVWSTRYRGPLVIVSCVARSGDADSLDYAEVDGPRGVTVCLVDLVDVRRATFEDCALACARTLAPTDFVWELRSPRRLAPWKVRGALGLYHLQPDALVVLADGGSVDVAVSA